MKEEKTTMQKTTAMVVGELESLLSTCSNMKDGLSSSAKTNMEFSEVFFATEKKHEAIGQAQGYEAAIDYIKIIEDVIERKINFYKTFYK